MENLMKQMRVRFSGVDEGIVEETSRVRDQNAQSPKTRSFKGDNRKSQNWYRRQSSRDPSYDYDSDYMESDEFRTAVAAAAYAVGSVQERRRSSRRRRDDSLNKGKSKADDGAISVTRRARERIGSSSSSSNKMKNKEDVPLSSPTFIPKKSPGSQEKLSDKTNDSFDKSGKRTPEHGFASTSSYPEQPTFAETDHVDRKHSEPTLEDVKADIWEKNEMERIKERYEKLNAKILEWETAKKAKAEKKVLKYKDETGKKRARALQNYKTETEMIDQIATGARSQAEENERKEAIKVKEKADVIRVTGKIPTKACLCF